LIGYDEYADIKTIRERNQNADRQARFKAKQNDVAVMVTDKKSVKMIDAGGDV